MEKKDLIVPRVGIVVLDGDKILLVKSQYDDKTFWIVPGGGVEFEEDAKDACIREMKEETGLDIEVEKFLYLREFIPKNGKDHVIDMFFKGKVVGGELITGEDPDNNKNVIKSVEFVSVSELDNLVVFPKVLPELIRKGLENDFADTPAYLGVCD